MALLNLGIVAHVDAGKTSLTERLLYAAGVIDELGSVDAGNTRTDTLALERRRGITIRSAVVSFTIGERTVNLIDTPGHPDFIAEVERVLSVLDGAVLVISAVEGVQAQTRILLRALRRLGIPTLIFVNKIDRRGAQDEALLRRITESLTPDAVAMVAVDGLGTRAAGIRPLDPAGPALLDLLTRHDDRLLADYVRAGSVSGHRLRTELATQSRRGLVHPVFFGSAVTGAGVDALVDGLAELLPAAGEDVDGPPTGTVFSIERGAAGERIASVRMFRGTLRTRDRLRFHRDTEGRSVEGRITAISVFENGSAEPRGAVGAGRIGQLRGLPDVRIGDTFGVPRSDAGDGRFAPPSLETVVLPRRAADRAALHLALTQLAEQDPLIALRQDELRGEISVSLYGEVQKEVIQATLADDYGVEVDFRETTPICIERPIGTGSAAEIIGTEANPFLATVGLRVEPGPVGGGVRVGLAVELGSMPRAFFAAVQESVHGALRQGLYGWQVTDCLVTVTRSGYWARQSHAHGTFDKSMSSTAGDFRNLTPLVLMAALQRAGSAVFEPMHRFRLEVPAGTLGAVMRVLSGLRAVPQTSAAVGRAEVLEGEIPAGTVHALRQQLPALTSGEGVLESDFDHYGPVTGPIPRRPRTDHNPLDRREYLLHVVRRV